MTACGNIYFIRNRIAQAKIMHEPDLCRKPRVHVGAHLCDTVYSMSRHPTDSLRSVS